MKKKTQHRKTYKWKKKARTSPIAKGRKAKVKGKPGTRRFSRSRPANQV